MSTMDLLGVTELFPLLQVGATEDLISPDTVDAVHAGAPGAGLFQPVDIRIPVGPIFNFVSGKSKNKKWCFPWFHRNHCSLKFKS